MGEGRLQRANELRRRAETHIASAGWLSARELLEDAVRLYREEGNRVGEMSCQRGLGDVALKLKENEVAAEWYRQALVTARELGDRGGEAEALQRQADLLRALERRPEARDCLERSAELYRELGHEGGEAQCLGLLGEVGREAGDPVEEVLALYRRASTLQLKCGDLRGAAVTLTFTANFLKDRNPARAAAAYVQAAEIYQGLGLAHRAEPFLAAARKLDPANAPAPVARPPGPWDSDD